MGARLIPVPYDSDVRDYRMGLGPSRLVQAGAAARLSENFGPVETVIVEPAPHAGAYDPACDPEGKALRVALDLLQFLGDRIGSR